MRRGKAIGSSRHVVGDGRPRGRRGQNSPHQVILTTVESLILQRMRAGRTRAQGRWMFAIGIRPSLDSRGIALPG